MKILKIVAFLLLFTSCSNKQNQITEFDGILGKKNINTLNLLVAEFENDFLKRQYPNLNTKNAYLKFVTEISESKTDHFVDYSDEFKNSFKKSELRLEIYCVTDSVWEVKKSVKDSTVFLKSRYKCLNPDGTFDHILSQSKTYIKESSIDAIKKNQLNFVESNFNGKYLKALNSISDKSDFFKSFVKDRTSLGVIPAELTAKRILAYDVDFNDYFVKRLIITELCN